MPCRFPFSNGCVQLEFLLMEKPSLLPVHIASRDDTIKGGRLLVCFIVNVVLEYSHWALHGDIRRQIVWVVGVIIVGFVQVACVV